MRCWAIIADFETRSRINLKKAGAWRYSVDASTDALRLGYRIDGGPRRMWKRGQPCPPDLRKAIEDGALFEAHNAFFEWCIWMNVMVRRYGWPPLKLPRMVCLAARAAFACLPRALELACYHMGIDGKGDDKAMKKLSKPRKPTKKNPKEWLEEEDYPELFEALTLYCDEDVRAESELSNKLRALPAFERRLFMADFLINLRGLRVDVDFVNAGIVCNRLINEELRKELTQITNGKVTAATQGERILAWLDEQGVELANCQAETVEDALFTNTELTKKQRRLLELRLEGNRASVRKLLAFPVMLDGDTVRGLYMYYGANAHGRFSAKGVQPQNFPRGYAKVWDKFGIPKHLVIEFMVEAIKEAAKKKDISILRDRFYMEESEVFGDPTSPRKKVPCPPAEVLSTALRGAFIPRKGKRYGVGDYAAIELRVLFWLADETYGLGLLRAGKDVYRDMGSVIFNKKPEDLDEGFERMLGKTTVLGCGYEMSWKKFKLTCKRAYSMIISTELCKKSVYGFRSRYKRVPRFWKELDKAAKACVKTGITKRVSKGRITFSMRNGDLVITLPSGREIYHRQARVTRDDDLMFVNGKGWVENTYGGKLCEYICSGTARDFLADAIVKAEFEEPDCDVVMHSHDELVGEGPKGIGKVIERVMLNVPKWGREMPMKVEAWEGDRYRK